jgi:chemotaxis protein MotB
LATSAVGSASDLKHQLEQALGSEIKNGTVTVRETGEGFVVSLRESGFFDSGQAVLLPTAADSVERIATPLISSGLSIRVEGHSDNVPIHNAHFKSNLDLSAARAMAVGSFLERTAGLDPSRVSVAGYGEYRPIASNGTPEGQSANRRVDILVLSPASPSGADAR